MKKKIEINRKVVKNFIDIYFFVCYEYKHNKTGMP